MLEQYKPHPDEFEKVQKVGHANVLTRPSLSYWQDAFRRLKKNKRAMAALFCLAFLFLFAFIGPFIWSVSPSAQDLNVISRPPAMRNDAIVVDPDDVFEVPMKQASEGEELALMTQGELPQVPNFKVVGEATTYAVRLTWDAVPGAKGYILYRSDVSVDANFSLGLPLKDIYDPQVLGYEDKLNLDPQRYYYSIVAKDDFQESIQVATLEVDVLSAVSLEEALKTHPNVQVGEIVNMGGHLFGTDYLGRDMLARLMRGGQVSLFIGLFAPLLFVLIGAVYGGFAGYLGGKVDSWLMRFADFVVALPFLLFMILFRVAAGIGPGESGILPMLMALVLLSWPSTARLVRGEILRLREEGFVQAARLLGAKPNYLLMRHMIPNTMGVILVNLTFAIPSAIFTEAFLSFIGMGVVPPTPSWGSMSNEGIKSMLNHPHELIFPAVFISLTVLAFNLLGDGLRDALDARMRSRE